MENIYFISGMGADETIFRNIHIPGCRLIYVPWVKHELNDDMVSYAMKMAAQIPEENPILLGLSFGGMLISEMTNHIKVKKAFLVSSSKNESELPALVVMNKWFISLNIVPGFLYTHTNDVMFYYLGAHSEEEKSLIRAMMGRADGAFMGWIAKAMAGWKNQNVNPVITHIHGTADHLISPRNVKPNYWIKDGSHIMLYNKAEEISGIITNELNSGDYL